MPTQIAAQMYGVREFTKTAADLAASFHRIRQIGFEAVQVSGIGPIDPKEVAKMLTDEGLICASTHIGWPRFLNERTAVIEQHKLWNCKHPAVGGVPWTDYASVEGLKRLCGEANEVGKDLAAAGMTFSYHNHNHELLKLDGHTTWLETFYENTDPRYVKAEIDVHWIQAGGGDPAQWVSKYPGRQPLLHLKDYVMSPDGKERRFAEIGQGNMNFPAILAAARQAKVEWYFIEQDDCYGRDPFESLRISLVNLHELGLK